MSSPSSSTEPATHKTGRHRTLSRNLIVAVGSSAIMIASILKKKLTAQGTDSLTRILGIDTDETTQAGADNGVPLSNNEYLYASMDRIHNVTDNPDQHPEMITRHDLADAGEVDACTQMIATDTTQAGQVRRLGNLSLQANWNEVKSAIQQGLQFLNSPHVDLRKQLESKCEYRISNKTSIYVIFSNPGGTGSSMGLEVMQMLRRLTVRMQVSLNGVMLMPSTFESVLSGDELQILRTRANGYATMRELNAVRTGAATGQKFGPGGRELFDAATDFCHSLIVISPEQANGKTLESTQAVYDTAALWLCQELGTELGERVRVFNDNRATLQAMAPDPATGQPCNLGTAGATALTFSSERCTEYSTALAAAELLEDKVIGSAGAAVEEEVLDWIGKPHPEDPIPIVGGSMAARLQQTIAPNAADAMVKRLYQHVGPTKKIHLPTSQFAVQAEQMMTTFIDTQVLAWDAASLKLANTMADKLLKAQRDLLRDITVRSGFRATGQAAQLLCQKLDAEITRLDQEQQQDQRRSEAAFAKAREGLAELSKLMRNPLKDKHRRVRIAGSIRTGITQAAAAAGKRAAHRICEALRGGAGKASATSEAVLLDAGKALTQLRSRASDYRSHAQITADTLAEIDVSSPATDAALYARFRPDFARLLHEMAATRNISVARLLTHLASDSAGLGELLRVLRHGFANKLKRVCIVDIIGWQLESPATAADMEARIRQAVRGCQPMWRAESGQLQTQFADIVLVGMPVSGIPQNRQLVHGAVMGSATRAINADGQYNSKAVDCEISDPHHIYIMRRTVGACFYYLPEVEDCKAAYDEWIRMGGHSLHIFNRRTVSRFPELIRQRQASPADAALALGVAFGMIARRGPRWYRNLQSHTGKFIVPLSSHLSCLAFSNGEARYSETALSQLVDAGRLEFGASDQIGDQQLLGQSLSEVREVLMDDTDFVRSVSGLLTELREVVGDLTVADELRDYAIELKRDIQRSHAEYVGLMMLADTLLGEADRISHS